MSILIHIRTFYYNDIIFWCEIAMSQDLVRLSQDLDDEGDEGKRPEKFLKLLDQAEEYASKHPVSKRIIVRHYRGAGDNLYFCTLDGTVIPTIQEFLRAPAVVFCNGNPTNFGDAHVVKFDHPLTTGVDRGDSFRLSVFYRGGTFLFKDEYSFSHWVVRNPDYMRGAMATVTFRAAL